MTVKICIVGEAWGEQEEQQRSPFVGPSGYELTKMLFEAGIHRAECFLTNVFNIRPRPTNDVSNLCTNKANGVAELGPISQGKYVRREFLPELDRLRSELTGLRPNLTILLGNTAAWAVLGTSGISRIRGTVTNGGRDPYQNFKVLPTFHPAAILRDWSLRHVTVLDLIKARRESEFPDIRRPERVIHIAESLNDIEHYFNHSLFSASSLAFDIETAGEQITCIGFAPSEKSALVIPFFDPRRTEPGRVGCYWPALQDELRAWAWVRRILSLPMPKFGQNTLYDINYLWTRYGITIVNYADDTMLLHHALHPESQKGLGFLGSVYTNESSWKLMNRKVASAKREK